MADVADGRGILQAALRERGFSHVTTWDRRRRSPYNRHGHRYGWFRHDTPDQYDAVVAMHPDEGTDHAILYAERHHIPAIICPCCVRPSAQPFWEPTKCHLWSAHLERMASTVSLHVRWDRLLMNGRNDVMIPALNQRAVGSTPTRPTKPRLRVPFAQISRRTDQPLR